MERFAGASDTAPAGPQPQSSGSGLGVTLLAALALIFFLRWAQQILIPFALATFLFTVLRPAVERIARWRFPRVAAASLVVVVASAAFCGILYSLSDEVAGAISQLPETTERLRQAARAAMRQADGGPIHDVREAAADLEASAAEALRAPPPPDGVTRVRVVEPALDVGRYLRWGGSGLSQLAVQILMIVFLAFFLLASGDLFKLKLVRIAGPGLARRKVTVALLDAMADQIGRYLWVLALTCTIVGVVTWGALALLGVPRAPFWGLAAGLFNVIPYFGPMVVGIALVAVTAVEVGSFGTALAAGAVSLVVTSLEGSLLTPWLSGRAARMNQVAVFAGLIFWSWIWGFWGMLLAVPLMMVLKTVADHVEGLAPLAELLSD